MSRLRWYLDEASPLAAAGAGLVAMLVIGVDSPPSHLALAAFLGIGFYLAVTVLQAIITDWGGESA